ncbi:MAG: sigma 54-interacting transcriptional regulator [Proteobacteria bacterium]|nr:sigma 54-interacting transcriptional regulator [Pseudomonadota bacterium]
MTRRAPQVLLIDDGDHYAEVIQRHIPEIALIQPHSDAPRRAIGDGPAAIAYLTQHSDAVDAVLLDMHFDVPETRLYPLADGASPRRTRRFQGVAILREIRARFPHLPVVLLTSREDVALADASFSLAGQSMTYVLGTNDLDTLRIRIHAALSDAGQVAEEAHILWGADPAMRTLRRRMQVLARGRMPVILEGETGTGKSWLAEKFIHVHSGRSGAFVVLDLSTIPTDLIPAHLFGAVKGAYTGAIETRKGVFEVAHKGTLLIDEIQNAPLDVQKQLLFVLQEQRIRPVGAHREVAVDVKVIVASNRLLHSEVAQGRFRSDLYMRLSPATRIHIPPLRQRPSDLRFLAERFVARTVADPDVAALRDEVARGLGMAAGMPIALDIGRTTPHRDSDTGISLTIPEPAWRAMHAHSWPGNIRELETLMHNIAVFTLVGAVDAIRQGVRITSPQLQVDPGLIGELLRATQLSLAPDAAPDAAPESGTGTDPAPGPDTDGSHRDQVMVHIARADTLNGVAKHVERQYFTALYQRCHRDFAQMARVLLGDETKARAVRLRFNQLGLKVRDFDR